MGYFSKSADTGRLNDAGTLPGWNGWSPQCGLARVRENPDHMTKPVGPLFDCAVAEWVKSAMRTPSVRGETYRTTRLKRLVVARLCRGGMGGSPQCGLDDVNTECTALAAGSTNWSLCRGGVGGVRIAD